MLPFHDISAHNHIQLAMTPTMVSRLELDIAGSLDKAVFAYLSGAGTARWARRSVPLSTAMPVN